MSVFQRGSTKPVERAGGGNKPNTFGFTLAIDKIEAGKESGSLVVHGKSLSPSFNGEVQPGQTMSVLIPADKNGLCHGFKRSLSRWTPQVDADTGEEKPAIDFAGTELVLSRCYTNKEGQVVANAQHVGSYVANGRATSPRVVESNVVAGHPIIGIRSGASSASIEVNSLNKGDEFIRAWETDGGKSQLSDVAVDGMLGTLSAAVEQKGMTSVRIPIYDVREAFDVKAVSDLSGIKESVMLLSESGKSSTFFLADGNKETIDRANKFLTENASVKAIPSYSTFLPPIKGGEFVKAYCNYLSSFVSGQEMSHQERWKAYEKDMSSCGFSMEQSGRFTPVTMVFAPSQYTDKKTGEIKQSHTLERTILQGQPNNAMPGVSFGGQAPVAEVSNVMDKSQMAAPTPDMVDLSDFNEGAEPGEPAASAPDTKRRSRAASMTF